MSTFQGEQPEVIAGQMSLGEDPADPEVYVAKQIHDCEGFSIVAVCRSEQAAHDAIADHKADAVYAADGYEVESYPLLPRLPENPCASVVPGVQLSDTEADALKYALRNTVNGADTPQRAAALARARRKLGVDPQDPEADKRGRVANFGTTEAVVRADHPGVLDPQDRKVYVVFGGDYEVRGLFGEERQEVDAAPLAVFATLEAAEAYEDDSVEWLDVRDFNVKRPSVPGVPSRNFTLQATQAYGMRDKLEWHIIGPAPASPDDSVTLVEIESPPVPTCGVVGPHGKPCTLAVDDVGNHVADYHRHMDGPRWEDAPAGTPPHKVLIPATDEGWFKLYRDDAVYLGMDPTEVNRLLNKRLPEGHTSWRTKANVMRSIRDEFKNR